MAFELVCSILIILAILLLIRVSYLVWDIMTCECSLKKAKSLRTVFCMGSGGHTTELLRFVKSINKKKYQTRLYILADNDVSSEVKIHETERGSDTYSLCRIPRSRNVQQSYFTSIFSTLNATWATFPAIYDFEPDVIFCNGPGTCIPVCFVAFVLRSLWLIDCRVVFIESICRVHTLSLTGKILQYFADIVIVQWPQLRDVCYRAKYFGRLT